MSSPLIRVCRKRSADPHEALVLHNKRAKNGISLVFTLFKAAAEGNDQELTGARVLDLTSQKRCLNEVPEDNETENPLGFVKDEAVGLVGEIAKQEKKQEKLQVSLNGRVLQPVSSTAAAPLADDIVYDYYAIHKNLGNAGDNSSWEADMEGADVRFANRDELNLEEDEDSDGVRADDDDDSNDEDNWRNDYPDEDSYDEDSDHGDPYGLLEPDNWHSGEAFSNDSFNRRLQNMDLNEERYETYFEGDDTDDDADY